MPLRKRESLFPNVNSYLSFSAPVSGQTFRCLLSLAPLIVFFSDFFASFYKHVLVWLILALLILHYILEKPSVESSCLIKPRLLMEPRYCLILVQHSIVLKTLMLSYSAWYVVGAR